MLALLTLSLWGCTSNQVPVAKVSGKVLFEDGTPVRLGIVEAISQEHGTTATGRIQEDGTFVLGTYTLEDGAAIGSHDVIVMQMIIAQGLEKHAKDHGKPVHKRFGSYETSSLQMTVDNTDENSIVLKVTPADY